MYPQPDPLVTVFEWFWAVFFTLCAIGYIAGQISKARRRGRPTLPPDVAKRLNDLAARRALRELQRGERGNRR